MAMSSQVRTVIELFCTILQQNNVSCIRAEMLRQAKYNKDSATSSMWKLLFDLITFCKSEDNKITPQNAKDEVLYVKTELQKFGYLSCRLSVLPPDMSSGSRELLLALGWLLHQQKVFDKIMSRRSDPLHQPLRNFVKLNVDSPEPLNTNALGDAIFKLPPRDAIQQQLMLCNKLHLACRRLHSFSQELRCLTHKIHQYTQGVSLQTELNHLTPLEVYLLRHPESLKQMMFELEKDNLELENLFSWKATEHVFWEWMQSVLNLHIQESATIDKKISRTEEVHLSLPTNIAKEIVSIRSSVREFIFHHESEIERLDQLLLEKIIKCTFSYRRNDHKLAFLSCWDFNILISFQKIAPSEIHVLASQVDSELTQLAGRLRHCGRGWDFTSDDMSSSDGTVTSIEPSSAALSDGFSKKSRPKFTPQSEKGIKAVKLESLQQEVTKERQLLEQRIKQLETQLKQLQLDTLAKLQTCLVTDPNIICIQPRGLKQLLNN
ncbi:tubulin epsilon and delta complex protein 1-like [Biomphalaria glabrata]|uniref:Tubulin epsilon and delta complex protein 1-like n=1 Tax=Biomphalaria glabrata TaxID=6526 RepID=A0A9W2ZX64_BIOGL|nr:tubulin epsilon and delta complex protein 1-like [Biomphalaria glabrata]